MSLKQFLFAFALAILGVIPGPLASQPGMIAIDTVTQQEVYVPDPLMFVHGVASNMQTYSPAFPTVYKYFREGFGSFTGARKYGFRHCCPTIEFQKAEKAFQRKRKSGKTGVIDLNLSLSFSASSMPERPPHEFRTHYFFPGNGLLTPTGLPPVREAV